MDKFKVNEIQGALDVLLKLALDFCPDEQKEDANAIDHVRGLLEIALDQAKREYINKLEVKRDSIDAKIIELEGKDGPITIRTNNYFDMRSKESKQTDE